MAQGDKRDSDQVQRFIDAAHKIGADEDKAQFEAQLAKIAAHKPESKPTQKKKRHGEKNGVHRTRDAGPK